MGMSFRTFRLKNILLLIFTIGVTVGAGFLSSLIAGMGSVKDFYSSLTLPPFAPESWVFPVVWTILYIFMGISFYKVIQKGVYSDKVRNGIFIYIVQLIVNTIWPIIFFKFNQLGLSVGVIVVLLALIIIMTVKFYKIDKSTLWLNLPYLLWVAFATILNIAIFMMN